MGDDDFSHVFASLGACDFSEFQIPRRQAELYTAPHPRLPIKSDLRPNGFVRIWHSLAC